MHEDDCLYTNAGTVYTQVPPYAQAWVIILPSWPGPVVTEQTDKKGDKEYFNILCYFGKQMKIGLNLKHVMNNINDFSHRIKNH